MSFSNSKSKKGNEAVLFVFNATESRDFELAKTCLERIITRKLLNDSTDELGLVVYGVQDSKDIEYENIVFPLELENCSWNILRYVKTEIQPSTCSANWFDAILLATDKLKMTENVNKRIILFGDFCNSVERGQLKDVIEEISSQDIGLTIIGPAEIVEEIYDDDEEPSPKRFKISEEQSNNVAIIKEMWEKLGEKMVMSSFEEVLRQVTVFKSEPRKSRAWNVDLTIGDISIPVSMFVKVSQSTKKPSTMTKFMAAPVSVAGMTPVEIMDVEATPLVPIREMTTVHQSGERISIEPEEVVKARRYGVTLVPFSNEDKAAMGYKSGFKCLSVFGFTSLAKLKRHYLVGKGCHVVTPRAKTNGLALSALIQAMNQLGRAAVARKVYSNDGGLSLVLLSPIWEEWDVDGEKVHKQCLALNELVWKEGLKLIPFPTLNYTATVEQAKAIDAMIDSMDLMSASKNVNGESAEAYQISQLVEEKNEFYIYCLVERALFPDKPLPKELPKKLQDISWPQPVREKQEAVKKLFPIDIKPDKKLERKQKFLAFKTIPIDGALQVDDVIEKVPLATKINNFPKPEIVSYDSKPVFDVKVVFREQMLPPPKAVVGILKIHLEDNEVNIDDALLCIEKCIMNLREFATKINPKEFNDWLSELRRIAPDSGGLYEFFSKIDAIAVADDSKMDLPQSEESDQVPSDYRSTLEIEKSQALHEFF